LPAARVRPTAVARGYFLGSLATGSTHRLLAKALVRLAPAELEMRRLHSRTCRSTIVTTMTTPPGGEEARGRRNSSGTTWRSSTHSSWGSIRSCPGTR